MGLLVAGFDGENGLKVLNGIVEAVFSDGVQPKLIMSVAQHGLHVFALVIRIQSAQIIQRGYRLGQVSFFVQVDRLEIKEPGCILSSL